MPHLVPHLLAIFGLFHAKPAEPTPPANPKPPTHERTGPTVVALAPDFLFPAAGKNRSLRSLRGQAVVLLVAKDASTSAFKKQLKELAPVYQEFASKGVIFIAALQSGDGPIKSNIPFVVAIDGPGVAAKYGVANKFQIAIVGRDGNIDYQTDKVLPGGRVRDVVQNSYVVQNESRKH